VIVVSRVSHGVGLFRPRRDASRGTNGVIMIRNNGGGQRSNPRKTREVEPQSDEYSERGATARAEQLSEEKRQADVSFFGPQNVASLYREPRSLVSATAVAGFLFVRCLFIGFAQVINQSVLSLRCEVDS
jgi:hypothetical protein